MEIIENKKNLLLKREEVIVLLDRDTTPSKSEALKMISEHFKTNEENVVIDRVDGKFGTKNIYIKAKIYESGEARKKFEVVLRKQRRKESKETTEKIS